MVNFTNDDILLYMNNELSIDKMIAFKRALLTDWSLKEKYDLLMTTQLQLKKPQSLLTPSKRTLTSIMNYAKEAVSERV